MHNDLSIELAKQVLIIDTEASGLDPLYHSILSIGLCPLIDRQYPQESNTPHENQELGLEIFVNEPCINTDPQAMAIHGITLKELEEKGLSPLKACLRFEDYLNQHFEQSVLLAGHNINFDLAFMKRLYRVAGRSWPKQLSHRTIDTHSLLWGLACANHIPKGACSSDGAFKFFNCAPPEALRHSALGDALATKTLLIKLLGLMHRGSN